MSSAQLPAAASIAEMAKSIAEAKWSTLSEPPAENTRRRQVENLCQLLRRMRDLASYAVQFRRAGMRWEVRAYTCCRIGTVVLSALAGAGLVVSLRVDPGQLIQLSWAAEGTLTVLGLNVVLELYKAFGVEKAALLAISAKNAGSLLRANVIPGLRNADPLPTLGALLAGADELARTFHDLLQSPSKEEVDALFRTWVEDYHGNWALTAEAQQSKKPRTKS